MEETGKFFLLMQFLKVLQLEIKEKQALFDQRVKDIAELWGVKPSYILKLLKSTVVEKV